VRLDGCYNFPQAVSSYEIQFVREIVAAGDLSSIDKLLQTLFGELGTKIPKVRNPRRLQWFRVWREKLTRVGELPSPPVSSGATVDPQELDLCARRVAASGDPDQVEALLHTIATELNRNAVWEPDRERKLWMCQAGYLLDLNMMEFAVDPAEEDVARLEALVPEAMTVRKHPVIRIVALLLLLLISLSAAALFRPGL
jgi:hypothetical protein